MNVEFYKKADNQVVAIWEVHGCVNVTNTNLKYSLDNNTYQ